MPYLTVDEQSTYIDVFCDGYIVRTYLTSSSYLVTIRNSDNDTTYFEFSPVLYTTAWYHARYDEDRETTILENSVSRVLVRVNFNWNDTYGSSGNNITNSTGCALTLTIYSDSILSSFVQSNSGTITIGSDGSNGPFNIDDITLTDESGVYGGSGSESASSTYSYYNSDQYLGTLSDEINLICGLVDLDTNGTVSKNMHTAAAGSFDIGINNGTLLTGDHRILGFISLDSVDREGSIKVYTAADRLAIANQHISRVL